MLALGTGVIGGFTTFSTLMLDFATLAPRHAIYATLLLMLNLLGGLLAATAGFLASKLVGRRDKKQW
ncbi:integral membrane protein for chromosome condensation [Lacticaseibacillus paracasei subsp. paracasei Lpp126]|uniref:Fluoride-specific ion channel n=1 Tax=Lacticaseibacillus paracasei subsp. paracasei Lpp126 TaxID=1256206 RepID=S2R670_LACPA|nr:integral membrane protein for chromosome condensation [Lacticaseibacillus paracasei subsp. paracasei Lpp126]